MYVLFFMYRIMIHFFCETIFSIIQMLGNERIRGAMSSKAQPGIIGAKKFSSLQEAKENESRLVEKYDQEKYEKIVNEIEDWIAIVQTDHINSADRDMLHEAILDIDYDDITVENVKNIIAEEALEDGETITDEQAQGLIDIINEARELEGLYYEGKRQRVVDNNEIKAIIAPKFALTNMELSVIRDMGINVIEYSGSENGRREALEKVQNEDVRFDLREGAYEEVKAAAEDKNITGDIQLTNTTPRILLGQKGVKNLPLVARAEHLRQNILTEEQAKEIGLPIDEDHHYHGLGTELYCKVINDLDKVTYAFRGTKNADDPNRRQDYFLLITQYEDAEGNIINIPIVINQRKNVNQVMIDNNFVLTVFGRKNINDYLSEQLRKGNLVRIKNRGPVSSEPTELRPVRYADVTSTDEAADQTAMASYTDNISLWNKKSQEENTNKHDLKYRDRFQQLMNGENDPGWSLEDQDTMDFYRERTNEDQRSAMYILDKIGRTMYGANGEEGRTRKGIWQKSIDKTAKELLDEYGSGYGRKFVAERLQDIYEMMDREPTNYAGALKMAFDLCEDIDKAAAQKQAKGTTPVEKLRGRLSGVAIELSRDQWNEVENTEGKKNFIQRAAMFMI